MKATDIKYLLLLEAVKADPGATHAGLAGALDVPQSLVNRYLKRLAAWGAIGNGAEARPAKKKYTLTPKGDTLLRQASWQFLAFFADELERLHARAVTDLSRQARKLRAARAVLYGNTPLTPQLARWAQEAGLTVSAVCDEERPGRNVRRLDALARLEYDCFILCDWGRATDTVLNSLLNHYAPVINPFTADGDALPKWR